MRVAKYCFNVLTFVGLWKPETIKSAWLKSIYNVYSTFVFVFKYFFASSFLISLYQNRNSNRVHIESICFFTTTLILAVKVSYLNVYRADLISLADLFLQKSCFPRNHKEAVIYKKGKEKERFVNKFFRYFKLGFHKKILMHQQFQILRHVMHHNLVHQTYQLVHQQFQIFRLLMPQHSAQWVYLFEISSALLWYALCTIQGFPEIWGNRTPKIDHSILLKHFRFIVRLFVISTFVTATLYLLWPLRDTTNLTLPFKSWIPYEVDTRTTFWITYTYQCCGLCFEGLVYTSTESLITILMQHICTQLEILIVRLLELTNVRKSSYVKMNIFMQESIIMKDCIDHHVCIYSMERQLNYVFSFLTSLQFFVSVLNLCTSGLYITKMNITSIYFWFSLVILCCFIFQKFIHCYFGEEMTRRSLSVADKVYEMDWNSLTLPSKQKLIMIMMRANRPIQLCGASVVVLSLQTFFKVLKTSYTSYNLLRNTN